MELSGTVPDPLGGPSGHPAARADDGLSSYATGERVVIRDEEWIVRTVSPATPGVRLEVTGASELVRDHEATFFSAIDEVRRLDPRQVRLVPDTSGAFLSTRLWLDAVMRRSPVPVADTRVVAGHRALLDHLDYQLRPARTMLSNLRPRLLIGDAVGLGKTLEIGIALSELIARGRGDRVLVVTPRAVLKQFQHEMFTRFGIPLVRLDSAGIQRVQRDLPAGRNPFAYFHRVIVSIDTLKNPHLYRHHLRSHRWDAVVIDECHNLINRGTQNNELARILAANSDALILASATPHNGSAESFAELVSLLDPTAIADPRSYSSADIAHLYVRRHRGSPEVRSEIADRWRERLQPTIHPVAPGAAEREVMAELDSVWLHPADGSAPVTGQGRTLFPWTLFKAFLSSPQALRSTIANRLRTLSGANGAAQTAERRALRRLDSLTAQVTAPAKTRALTSLLKELGVGRDSDTRVVVFSERIDTIEMLARELPGRLHMPKDAVRTLYASQSDDTIQSTVESFGQKRSPIRVLLASDMASEGLNLHKQCHLLVHYDVPWSFIRLQQRNGRIDRYGQRHAPAIHALALADEEATSEVRVVTSLLTKEHEANRALGDAGVLMDLDVTEYDGGLEERAVMDALARGRTVEDVSAAPARVVADNPFLRVALGLAGDAPGGGAPAGTRPPDAQSPDVRPPVARTGPHRDGALSGTAEVARLFADDDDYVAAVLRGTMTPAEREELQVRRDSKHDLLELRTDSAVALRSGLRTRLRNLPRELVRGEDSVLDAIAVTGSGPLAERRLQAAQESTSSGDAWPDVQFLTPAHPVAEWAADRGLGVTERGTALVVTGEVDQPTYLTQATWANGAGQVVIASLDAVGVALPDTGQGSRGSGVEDAGRTSSAGPSVVGIEDMVTLLRRAGLDDRAINTGALEEELLERLRPGVPVALDAATTALHRRRTEFEGDFDQRLAADRERLSVWHQESLDHLTLPSVSCARRERIERTAQGIDDLITSMQVTGEPHVRLLAVIVPRSM